MRKSTIKTEHELFRQVIIWHPLGIFDIAIKSKLWKSINETEQELIRQFSIWHHLGICNIVKQLKWWNNNILQFLCILNDFLIFRFCVFRLIFSEIIAKNRVIFDEAEQELFQPVYHLTPARHFWYCWKIKIAKKH